MLSVTEHLFHPELKCVITVQSTIMQGLLELERKLLRFFRINILYNRLDTSPLPYSSKEFEKWLSLGPSDTGRCSTCLLESRGVLHKTRIKKSRIIEQAQLELVCSAHSGLIGCTIAEAG